MTLLNLPRRSDPTPPPPVPAPPRAPASAAATPVRAETPARRRRDAAPSADWQVKAADPAETGTARAALRARLGCRAADFLGLSKAERVACQTALAKGVEDAPAYAVVSPKLRKVFEGTFECPPGDVWCEYRIGKAPYPGLLAPRKPKRDPSWDQ